MTQTSPIATDEPHLQRNLTNRHIQLIAIGGAIGTGLFMGSGKTISLAGPSIIFVYMIIGFMLFFVMRAMGELLLSNLNYKSFIDFSADLLGPWAGYFTGWTYWFCWVVTGIADVVAIAAYTQFWFPDLPQWIPALTCVGLLLSLNLVTVKMFGEMEFWFALIKIVAILGLVATGLYMVITGFTSPSGRTAQLANLWNDGGMFPHGLMGFFAGFQIAVFAFVGIELVGTTAAEAKNPERTLPRAINSIPIRIIVFYVLALIAIMAVTPWRDVVPGKSPFVELFVLYGLSQEGDAPKAFEKLSSRSVPANGLYFSCTCLLLGAVLIYLVPNVVEAFTLVTTVSAVLFMFVWTLILLSYLKYRKNRAALHQASNYKMPGGRFMCYVCLSFFAFILVLLSLEADTRSALVVTPIWFVVLAVTYQLVRSRRHPRTAVRNG
jgi:D-serine/D-alanine/glycine transporter